MRPTKMLVLATLAGAFGSPNETDETWTDVGVGAVQSCSERLRQYCFSDSVR
jgi:hypothetical protein